MKKLPHKFMKKSINVLFASTFVIGSLTGCGVSQNAATSGEPAKDNFSLYGNGKDSSDVSKDEDGSDGASGERFDENSNDVVNKTAEIEKLIDNYF